MHVYIYICLYKYSYTCMYTFVVKFDSSTPALKKTALAFSKKGQHGLFQNCVGCIDGLAVKIRLPPKSKCANVSRFHSGGKNANVMNFQGICSSDYSFSAVTCMHVGSTNDAKAFETSSLKALCDNLPFPFHLNGDPAYTSSETMMVPYPGTNLHELFPYKESFNFFHSQIRIYIECTFGIFVRRWGILWKPLAFDMDFMFELIHALCRLHNLCVRRNTPVMSKYSDVMCDPILEVDVDGRLVNEMWRSNQTFDQSIPVSGYNTVRESILSQITSRNILKIRNHHLS
jgi:hypothetical protein